MSRLCSLYTSFLSTMKNWSGSSLVEPVLSKDKYVLLKDTTQQYWGPSVSSQALYPLYHWAPALPSFCLLKSSRLCMHTRAGRGQYEESFWETTMTLGKIVQELFLF